MGLFFFFPPPLRFVSSLSLEGRGHILTGFFPNQIPDKVAPYQDKHWYWIPAFAGMTDGLLL